PDDTADDDTADDDTADDDATDDTASDDAADDTASDGTADDPDVSATSDPAFAEIDATVAAFVEDRGLNGAGLAIVDAEDGVVHEAYWGEFEPNRASFIASSSKQLVAGVMLRLQDEGLLDIDAPLPEIVGDDWGPGVADITVAQMLSNSSGLVGLVPNPLYPPYLCQFFGEQQLEECGATIATTDDDDAEVAPPDSEFRYGGGQWQVAGAVAEYVSGETWDELIDRIYVEPCGLSEGFGFDNHWGVIGDGFTYPADFDGDLSQLPDATNPHMEGGAYSTVPDYAELLLLHLRGGECPNGPVVSQAALDTMHADRVAAAYGGNAGGATTGYGMGWWIDRETGRISDGGAYGSQPWLDLDDGYGAYLVVEADSSVGQALAGEIEELVHTAMTT
ncbi:MAG: serine hydrolase domain-containing protein, partial [Actinomycetota bacterium]